MNRRILKASAVACTLLLAMLSVASAQGPAPGGLLLWNRLESESGGVVASQVGPDGIRLSWPNDSNASSFGYEPARFGNGIARTELWYVSTPNEFLSFGVDEEDHTGISIERGTIEFWWKAVEFGDWVAGYWLESSKSSSERADNGGSGNWPRLSLSFNSWDYGQGNLRDVAFQIRIAGRSDKLHCRIQEDGLGGDFVPGTWYHLGLVWDVDGIPGDPDGHKIAIYRDGVKWSQVQVQGDLNVDIDPYVRALWFPGTRPTEYAGDGAYYYNLWGTYDNIQAWNYAKTDFSDRFDEAPTLSVSIDVKPGGDRNVVNPKSRGKVRVAVLTRDAFDANSIDPGTVLFAGAPPVRWTLTDVDKDGNDDMLFSFETHELDLTQESIEATLTGKTLQGLQIAGTDTVCVVPRKK